ncbi:hypothetical protein Tsubulata_006806 [Turnera subulata]|uniref:C3H1-type domain-containing protein n=1 Tax=Turnera subulata TaxID=218843 RepID=A0A9Q0FB18_9ROSI|nr:hypothetical protein Tsubulata_006806 [Turnera subulata]
MKRSKRPDRVSWASGGKLVQVRLFLTEDCPYKVGMQAGHRISQQSNADQSTDLPPGFEGSFHLNRLGKQFSSGCSHLNQLKKQFPSIPKIEWKSPPKFIMNYDWRVAMGEQSNESEVEKLREARVFEAVYPRVSLIPSSPSVSWEIEDEKYDDRLTPVIPIIPIEEEEAEAVDVPSNSSAPFSAPIGSQPTISSETSSYEKPAVVVLPDLTKKLKEHESLIDPDLLIKIFSNPKMIQELMNDHRAPVTAANEPIPDLKPVGRSVSSQNSAIVSVPLPANPAIVSVPLPAKGMFHHNSLEVQPAPKPDNIAQSSSEPAKPVTPFPANGRLCQHTSIKLAPPPVAMQTTPTSISKHEFEPMDISAPIPNSYSKPNPVQPTLNSLPTLNGLDPSFMAKKPNPTFSMLPSHHLGVTPALQHSVSRPSITSMETNKARDVNYFKNLIREHGTEKHELQDRSMPHFPPTRFNHNQNMEFMHNGKQGELDAKYRKPCMYFNSPRGCRNGSKCTYRHDPSFDIQTESRVEVPCAKRMRFGGELSVRI